MGMFDKDKEIGNRIDTEFEIREDFILWAAEVSPDLITTEIGDARKTLMEVSRLDEPDIHFEVTSLASAIADKAELADPSDFPAVVQLRKVASRFGNEALVLQFVRSYK
jgi:hypothetical protein